MAAKRIFRRAQRSSQSVLGAFLILFLLSSIVSWFVWDKYYEGMFKRKIFEAVLLGNMVTSAVGALMVYSARSR